MRQAQTRSEVESAIKARGADVYAGFLLPYLRPDMSVLDCGCGKATITLGLAEAVPNGRVVGVDLDKDSLLAARYSAVLIGRGNLASSSPTVDSYLFTMQPWMQSFATPCLRHWTILRML